MDWNEVREKKSKAYVRACVRVCVRQVSTVDIAICKFHANATIFYKRVHYEKGSLENALTHRYIDLFNRLANSLGLKDSLAFFWIGYFKISLGIAREQRVYYYYK